MSSHLTAEILWSIPRVGSAAVAGNTVVVPITAYPATPGQGTTRIWRIHTDGSPPSPLTGSSASATKPALSPNGARLAFLRVVDGRHQIHVMPIDGGEPEPVTDLPLGVTGFRWFPDGERLLAIADVYAEGPTPAATARIRDEREDQTTSARTTEDGVFRYWDRWLTEGRYPHLFVIAPGSEPMDLTPESTRWMRWDNTDDPTDDVAISPDGTQVAACFDMSTPPHRHLRWSLVTIEIESGAETERTPDDTGQVSGPRYSADGRYLVYGKTIDPDFYADRVRIMRLDLTQGTAIELSDGWDRSPSAWDVGASDLVLVAEDHGRQPLWTLPLEGGTPVRLPGSGTLAAPARLADGRIVATHNSIISPPELVIVDRAGVAPLTTFTVDALSDVKLPEVAEIQFEGGRGDTVQAWVVRPSEMAHPAPLVHMIHGGPHGTFGDTWHWRWNAAVFSGVSRLTVLVNFHGSTGFGQEFAECIRGEWGDLPALDLEAATDHLVATGVADPDRMALAGGSYGGYMAAWLVSQTDRYRCAVAHAPVTALPGMYASDITAGRAHSYGAEVWDDLDRVNRWSPAAHAAGYGTPTLVIHGERDYRVPVTQGLEFYGVLRAKGIDARLVYYPDENHWILSQGNSIHWYGEVATWLDRYLG